MKNNVLKFQLPAENKYLIHLLFKDFAKSQAPLVREVVCALTSSLMLWIGFVIVFGARFFSPKNYLMPQEQQQALLANVGYPVPVTAEQEILAFFLAALALVVCFRLMTLIFHRLSAPFNWLFAPLPLVSLIWGLNKLAVQTDLMQSIFMRVPSTPVAFYDTSVAAIFGQVTGFVIVCLCFWCYGASRPSEDKRLPEPTTVKS